MSSHAILTMVSPLVVRQGTHFRLIEEIFSQTDLQIARMRKWTTCHMTYWSIADVIDQDEALTRAILDSAKRPDFKSWIIVLFEPVSHKAHLYPDALHDVLGPTDRSLCSKEHLRDKFRVLPSGPTERLHDTVIDVIPQDKTKLVANMLFDERIQTYDFG